MGYEVFAARPKKPDEPNAIFMITYPNMAAFDRRVEENAVAVEMIGSAKEQDKARIARSAYRCRADSRSYPEVTHSSKIDIDLAGLCCLTIHSSQRQFVARLE